MRRMTTVLGVCAAVGWVWGVLLAETPDTKDRADAPHAAAAPPQIAEEIRQRLMEPITLKLENVSIPDALEQILKQHGFEYWVDEAALHEESIKLDDIEVRCNLQNVSYRAALKRILGPSNLAWIREDAGICITSRARQERTYFARVYDVADLIPENTESSNSHPGTAAADLQAKGSQPQSGSVPRNVPAAPVAKSQAASDEAALSTPPSHPAPHVTIDLNTPAPASTLSHAIQELVGGSQSGGPWILADGEGGTVHYIQTTNARLLVVKQNEATHAAIEDLLNDLISHDQAGSGEEVGTTARDKTAARKNPIPSRVRIVGRRR